jgi:hypothetical protein
MGYGNDPANEAIAKADRTLGLGQRVMHRYGCRTDGGTQTHGKHGFDCPRCAQLKEDDGGESVIRFLSRGTP